MRHKSSTLTSSHRDLSFFLLCFKFEAPLIDSWMYTSVVCNGLSMVNTALLS